MQGLQAAVAAWSTVAAAAQRRRQRRKAEVAWGGGGGSGSMIKGEDKQQSNNGCVGKWQQKQKYEEQKWTVVGECGGFRRLATQLQRPESHENKDLGMNGLDYVVSLVDRIKSKTSMNENEENRNDAYRARPLSFGQTFSTLYARLQSPSISVAPPKLLFLLVAISNSKLLLHPILPTTAIISPVFVHGYTNPPSE